MKTPSQTSQPTQGNQTTNAHQVQTDITDPNHPQQQNNYWWVPFPLALCLSVCLYLPLPLSFCMSVCLSVCLFLCLSVCLFLPLSFCLCLSLYIWLPLSLSVGRSVCLPVCLTLCLSVFICLCVCLSLSFCLSAYVCVCVSVRLSEKKQELDNQNTVAAVRREKVREYLFLTGIAFLEKYFFFLFLQIPVFEVCQTFSWDR